MAFQVADDLLDYTETESVTGKPSGNDLKEHKVTLPLIAALVHRRSGHVRERSAIDAALAVGGASRWRICGTPSEPLQLDDDGRTL